MAGLRFNTEFNSLGVWFNVIVFVVVVVVVFRVKKPASTWLERC